MNQPLSETVKNLKTAKDYNEFVNSIQSMSSEEWERYAIDNDIKWVMGLDPRVEMLNILRGEAAYHTRKEANPNWTIDQELELMMEYWRKY